MGTLRKSDGVTVFSQEGVGKSAGSSLERSPRSSGGPTGRSIPPRCSRVCPTTCANAGTKAT